MVYGIQFPGRAQAVGITVAPEPPMAVGKIPASVTRVADVMASGSEEVATVAVNATATVGKGCKVRVGALVMPSVGWLTRVKVRLGTSVAVEVGVCVSVAMLVEE